MVEYEQKSCWTCPYCNKEYDNEDDAYDCARDCADIDYPSEEKKTICICQFCKKKFDKEEDAEKCEEEHKENDDEFYSKVKLQEASEHPSQKRLS